MIVLNLVLLGLAITLEPIPLTAFILVPRRSSRAPAPWPAEGWLLFCFTAVVKPSGQRLSSLSLWGLMTLPCVGAAGAR